MKDEDLERELLSDLASIVLIVIALGGMRAAREPSGKDLSDSSAASGITDRLRIYESAVGGREIANSLTDKRERNLDCGRVTGQLDITIS